jgi:NAD-dependent epimerase/dehydratase family protein
MKRALIGHTGFVGSNLKRQEAFTHLYNSRNFRELKGEWFDEVLCAGVSAAKWLANKDPQGDWQGIKALLDTLSEVETGRFTLISTIDVYPDPSKPQDETFIPSPEEGQPYGRHRALIERFVEERFDDVLIARLPALFGAGLKKNIIFDLLTGNQIEKINPKAVFQWYPLDRLARDLELARKAKLSLVNIFTEPTESERLLCELFDGITVGPPIEPAPRYDLRTIHAGVFGGSGSYVMGSEEVMRQLANFVSKARAAPAEVFGG